MCGGREATVIGTSGTTGHGGVEQGGFIGWDDGTLTYIVPALPETGSETMLLYTIGISRLPPDRWRSLWFESKLKGIAKDAGIEEVELRRSLASEDLADRTMAYALVIGALGPQNFNNSPASMTRAEVRRRYTPVEKKLTKAGGARYFGG